MRDACGKYKVFIWTYTLMGNHVHHVAVPEEEDSLSKTIKVAHGEYTSYLNKKYGLVGHAWQGRFKSFPMDESHCHNAIRYIERNPVRAGILPRAEDYLWSSAAAHCGLRDDLLLSGDCPLVGQIDNWSDWLKIDSDDLFRDTFHQHTATGRPLGSKQFLIDVGKKIGRDLLPRKRGPRPKTKQSETSEPSILVIG
jgi:putative transposase